MTIRNLPQHVFICPFPTLCITLYFISTCYTLLGFLTFKYCEYMYLMKIIKYVSLVNLPRYLFFLVLFLLRLADQLSFFFGLKNFLQHFFSCSLLNMKSLSFCLHEDVFISHHFWRIIFTVYKILGWQIFPPFGTLNMSSYFCLHCFLTKSHL